MDQSRHRHVRVFPAWVRHVVGRTPRFLDPRNHLTPDRIVRIFARDQIEKVRRNRERQLVAGEQNAGAFLFAQRKVFLQLTQLSDAVLQLPFPVVPKFRRNTPIARPIARRVRKERLFLLNSIGEIHHFRICVEKT